MPINRDELKKFGAGIKAAREMRSLTQKEIAQRIGKSVETISNYEQGTRAPHVTELPELARALDVPLDYFFQPALETEPPMLEKRIEALPEGKQIEMRIFLGTLLDFLEEPEPSRRSTFPSLYMLIYWIFEVTTYEDAVKIVPDYRK